MLYRALRRTHCRAVGNKHAIVRNTSSVPSAKLLNGNSMPLVGLGHPIPRVKFFLACVVRTGSHTTTASSTWRMPPTDDTTNAIIHAIGAGYRHIDCAAIYKNEVQVGAGIKKALEKFGLKRKDLFITSKLWNTEHHPDRVRTACEQSIKDLGLDYLDMYLIHWPVAEIPPDQGVVIAGDPASEDVQLWETFEAMKLLKAEGLTKGIGVSNFNITQISDIINDCDAVPDVNQVEFHPYLNQKKLLSYCESKGIVLTGYSTLGSGKAPANEDLPALLDNPVVMEIAAQLAKTPAQVLLRWAVQQNVVVIPKSLTPARIEENFNIFDFELNKEHMEALGSLNKNYRFVKPQFYDFPEDRI